METYSLIKRLLAYQGFTVESEGDVDHPPVFHLMDRRSLKDTKYEVSERRDELWVINFTVETDLVKGFGQMELSHDAVYMFDGEIDHVEWIHEDGVVYPVVHTSEGQARPKRKYEHF